MVRQEGSAILIRTEGQKCKFKANCPLKQQPLEQKTAVTLRLNERGPNGNNCASPSLTKAADGVGVVLSLKLDGGLLRVALLVVTQPVALDGHRFRGELPACYDGGAVQRLKLKDRGWRHCWAEAAGMGSICGQL